MDGQKDLKTKEKGRSKNVQIEEQKTVRKKMSKETDGQTSGLIKDYSKD